MGTPSDNKSRDPIQWLLQGSNDGVRWVPLHCQSTDHETLSGVRSPPFDFKPAVKRLQPPFASSGEDWYRLRVRAIGNQVCAYFKEELTMNFMDASNKQGSFGVWCA